MTVPALPAGLTAASSAVLFAVGSSMQHRAVGSAPHPSERMIRDFLTRPSWLIGAVLCATAFLLHATALSWGDITLVQPIILSGIVFAVLARPLLDHRLPSAPEMGWAAVTWSGLALFVLTLKSAAPRHPPDSGALLVLFGAALTAVAVLLMVARLNRRRLVLRGAALAVAAGVLYGLVAGLLKLTTTTVAAHGIGAAVASWPPWVLVVVGGCAVLANQRAYQSTRLSVTAPLLNIAQLLVSVCFGVVVLGERPFIGGSGHTAEVAGLLVMMLGVIRLSVHASEGSAHRTPTVGESPQPGRPPRSSAEPTRAR